MEKRMWFLNKTRLTKSLDKAVNINEKLCALAVEKSI
jgi:hypothetical protein